MIDITTGTIDILYFKCPTIHNSRMDWMIILVILTILRITMVYNMILKLMLISTQYFGNNFKADKVEPRIYYNVRVNTLEVSEMAALSHLILRLRI